MRRILARHRERPDIALFDILRLAGDRDSPPEGELAVTIAKKIQHALGQAIGYNLPQEIFELLVRAGQSCERLVIYGWCQDETQREHCTQSVQTFLSELGDIRSWLVAADQDVVNDPYPVATALHTELVCFPRHDQQVNTDPITEVRALITWCRAMPVSSPAELGRLADQLITAGDRLTAQWPVTPDNPSLDTYLTFHDALRAFEAVSDQVRHDLRDVHPRLRAWPADR